MQILTYDIDDADSPEESNKFDSPNTKKSDKQTEISEQHPTIANTKCIKVQEKKKQKQKVETNNYQPVSHLSGKKNLENIIFYEEEQEIQNNHSSNIMISQNSKRQLLQKSSERQVLIMHERQSDENISEEESSDDYYDEDAQEQKREENGMKEQRIKSTVQLLQLQNGFILQSNICKMIKHIVLDHFKITCLIVVESRMLGLSHKYSLYLASNKSFLMSAKKQLLTFHSNFIISLSETAINQRTSAFLARVQANFTGTAFKLIQIHQSNQSQEATLHIAYQKNIIGITGLRSFTVSKINPQAFRKKNHLIPTLESIMEKKQKSKIFELTTQQPKMINGKYKLDFEGKAKLPSAKNFILEQKNTHKSCLLFTKVKEDTYLMEIKHPLSILEGFAICLSSLDSKLFVN